MSEIQKRVQNCDVSATSIKMDKTRGFEELIWVLSQVDGPRRATDIEATRYMEELLGSIIAVANLGKFSQSDFRLLFVKFDGPEDGWPMVETYPGGFIVIEERIFLHVSSEAALVHVIAHEVAHTVLRSVLCQQQFTESPDIKPMMDYQKAIKRCALEDRDCQDLFLAVLLINQAFERAQESRADIWAVERLLRMGYDTESVLSSLKKCCPEKLNEKIIKLLEPSLTGEPHPAFIIATPEKFMRIQERFQKKYPVPQ